MMDMQMARQRQQDAINQAAKRHLEEKMLVIILY
jgi:hypothetical protein